MWRPLTGRDELELGACDYLAAIDWLRNMLAPGTSGLRPDEVGDLGVADVDRLFAGIYRCLFGDHVEMRQSCTDCGKAFELTISLDQLVGEGEPDPAGIDLPGGTRLSPVTVDQLMRAAADEAMEALINLAIAAQGSDDRAAIIAAFDRLASPALETLETDCPHCSRVQHIAFDLSRFLLACAARERSLLLRETHLLARAYGWSFEEIMGLDRSTRHEFVRLVAGAAAMPRRAA